MKKIKFKNQKKRNNVHINVILALSTSLLVICATLGIATYAVFFINNMFNYVLPHDELYSKLLIFKDSLRRLVLAFLAFGLISSYYTTKFIISPIKDLIKGTKELAEGKLDHRLDQTKYAEINELIENYNKMAENLQSLYINLEQLVHERTAELEKANEEIKNAQAMIIHSEKMRSLGQLVAGITHEINNPINFIYGNLMHLKNYSNALLGIIENYQSMESNLSEEDQAKLQQTKEKFELEFIKEDLPLLIKSCQEGTERTKDIVSELKTFSRIDEMIINDIDLEKEIDTTLNILKNKIKNKIEIIKDYAPQMPLVEGYGGQLNQVFMNIFDNACYAIKESGKIYVRLKNDKEKVTIEIEDTGSGMDSEQMAKIFEPFYTTKPVGEGSGLGMSIGYKVIQNHHGTIEVNSEVGKGTLFTIQLPIKMKKELGNQNGRNQI